MSFRAQTSHGGAHAALNTLTAAEVERVPQLTPPADGQSGLTTATAAARRGSGSVRSRSRSPHPAASAAAPPPPPPPPPPQRRDDTWVKTDPVAHQRPLQVGTDLDDRSLELEPFLPTPENFGIADATPPHPRHRDADTTTTSASEKPLSLRARLGKKLESVEGPLMVLAAMFFGASMGAIARVMETGPDPMHTFQILFARQSITAALSMLYMWWQRVPDAPLGRKEVRPLLLARGVGGFFGVFGLYYSVKYLPLAEATVITFLAPMAANAICSLFLKDPFTRRQQLAGVVSLIGVVFIARPTSLLGSGAGSGNASDGVDSTATMSGDASSSSSPVHAPEVTPSQRLFAIGIALLGVCGAACAYTTIRWIGKRAHPLISVNYFSVWCTLVSVVALVFVPSVPFRLPADAREWLLLTSLGCSGMIMQFLLTAGLARQRGSAATNMTYTQMIFTLVIDYAIWGTVLTWASWVGAGLILGSQIWGAMAKGDKDKESRSVDAGRQVAQRDEEIGLTQAVRVSDEIVVEENRAGMGRQ